MKNNLKSLRTKAGFSLQELGDLCGKSKAQLHALEKDDANPTLKTAYALACVFDVAVTDIWPNDLEVVEEVVTIRRVKTAAN